MLRVVCGPEGHSRQKRISQSVELSERLHRHTHTGIKNSKERVGGSDP